MEIFSYHYRFPTFTSLIDKMDVRNLYAKMFFEIAKGEQLAIVGKSGCGKNTLLKLCAGLYAPVGGNIMVSGTVVYVSQNSFLFTGSLRDNLTCGRTMEDNQIWEVLEQVQMREYVQNHGGLEAAVTVRGDNLSGGQRQRLCIARASPQWQVYASIFIDLNPVV